MLIPQRARNKFTAVSERIACKDKCYFSLRQIATNNSSVIIGQGFFFTFLVSLSLAANKYTRLAVPSIVGSLVT